MRMHKRMIFHTHLFFFYESYSAVLKWGLGDHMCSHELKFGQLEARGALSLALYTRLKCFLDFYLVM